VADGDEDTIEISNELVAAPGTRSRRLVPKRPLKPLEHNLIIVSSYRKRKGDSFEPDWDFFPLNIPAFIKKTQPGSAYRDFLISPFKTRGSKLFFEIPPQTL
jgi:hypothetical protein